MITSFKDFSVNKLYNMQIYAQFLLKLFYFSTMLNFKYTILTHFSLETHKMVIGKQCRPRSDTTASDQVLHCSQIN